MNYQVYYPTVKTTFLFETLEEAKGALKAARQNKIKAILSKC
jgi:hypothetical protein